MVELSNSNIYFSQFLQICLKLTIYFCRFYNIIVTYNSQIGISFYIIRKFSVTILKLSMQIFLTRIYYITDFLRLNQNVNFLIFFNRGGYARPQKKPDANVRPDESIHITSLFFRSELSGSYGVAHQHGYRHRTYAAGNRGYRSGDLLDVLKVHVSA